MKITPLDIRQQQFTAKWRGYDAEEVDAFLEAVALDLEVLLKERVNLQERVTALKDELQHARSEESEIKEMLLAVHRVREDLVAQAGKEAQLILKEARLRGDEMLRLCREKQDRMTAKVVDIERQYNLFKAKLRALVEAHVQLLNDASTVTEPTEPGRKHADVEASAPTTSDAARNDLSTHDNEKEQSTATPKAGQRKRAADAPQDKQ